MQQQVCLIPSRNGHLACCFQKRASSRASKHPTAEARDPTRRLQYMYIL
jgi:hypothetical protein